MHAHLIEDRIFFSEVLSRWRWHAWTRDHERPQMISVYWNDLELLVPLAGGEKDQAGVVVSKNGIYRVDVYNGQAITERGIKFAWASNGVFEFLVPLALEIADEDFQTKVDLLVAAMRIEVAMRLPPPDLVF